MIPILMSELDLVDLLRGRLARHKHGRTFGQIAPAIGVGPDVLARFMRGMGIHRQARDKIHVWCALQQESAGLLDDAPADLPDTAVS